MLPLKPHDDRVHSEAFSHTLMRQPLKLSVSCAAMLLIGFIRILFIAELLRLLGAFGALTTWGAHHAAVRTS